MRYVDGFIVPVPKKSVQAYRRMAQKAGKVWREHGALEFRECIAEDVKVGKLTSFPRSVKLKAGETVTVVVNPLRTGEHGGIFVSIKLADGRVLGDKWTEEIESTGTVSPR